MPPLRSAIIPAALLRGIGRYHGRRRFSSPTADWPAPTGLTHVSGVNQGALYSGNAAADPLLALAARMYAPAAPSASLSTFHDLGAWAGSAATMDAAFLAQSRPPVLLSHDRNGNRINAVRYSSEYHSLMGHAVRAGVPSHAWRHSYPGAHVLRSLLSMLAYIAEPGASCPLTMTFAGVPALAPYREVYASLLEKATSCEYDARDVPAADKKGIVLAMSMTEKTGGSDVRSGTTRATRVSSGSAASTSPSVGDAYTLRGHKWFTSAPMSDAFLTLAYAEGHDAAPSCFLVPRWLPSGDFNRGLMIMRLKEKLGDRSNASSELEYDNAVGTLLGPPGRGVATILEMVVHTRLDCATGSAALMRQATRTALAYCDQRVAFGTKLSRAPVMQTLCAQLAVDSGVAALAALRVAAMFDSCARGAPQGEQALRRLAVAVTKYFNCKRAPGIVVEAAECMGGNGYVEEWHFPRWYRQAPLNSVWEGSGNVMALDVLRTVVKEPEAVRAFDALLQGVLGVHAPLDGRLQLARKVCADIGRVAREEPVHARWAVEALAMGLQAVVLAEAVQFGAPAAQARANVWAAYHGEQPHGMASTALGALPMYAAHKLRVEDVNAVLQDELTALEAGREKVPL